MNKSKLSPETLAVASFETTLVEPGEGTVIANQGSLIMTCAQCGLEGAAADEESEKRPDDSQRGSGGDDPDEGPAPQTDTEVNPL